MFDHREIGRQLDLFMFHPLSPGCPIWLDKGVTVYNILAEKIRRLNREFGYFEVRTPVLWRPDLYRTSGHMDHYAENMYFTQGHGDQDTEGDGGFVLKPMNCPGHMLIYKSRQFSYHELPFRVSDLGPLHRNETSGAIGGLTRCRSFCQDDGHVFLANTGNSIGEEVRLMISMVQRVYRVFDMPLRVVLGKRPEKFMGSLGDWHSAEHALFSAVVGMEHSVDLGGGAFYGPKIDFFVKDSQGREWQTATIQLDYQLPERFDLQYNGGLHDGQVLMCRPVVIHRAMYGSFERFIGILLEHFQGKLPPWLAPVQAVFLPVSEKHEAYCRQKAAEFEAAGVRTALDAEGPLNGRIRRSEERRIPYMLVAGNREVEHRRLSLRLLQPDLGPDVLVQDLTNGYDPDVLVRYIKSCDKEF